MRMSKPEFNMQFSLGNITTILFGVIAVAVSWGVIGQKLSTLEVAVGTNTTAIMSERAERHARMEALATRMGQTETEVARQDEKWASVIGQLSRIENTLNRLNDRLDRTNGARP